MEERNAQTSAMYKRKGKDQRSSQVLHQVTAAEDVECQLSYVLNQIRGTFQGLVTRHHKEVKQFHSHLKTVTNPKDVQIERMAALQKDLSIDFNLCCEELKYIAKEHTKKTKKLNSAIIKSESDESSLKDQRSSQVLHQVTAAEDVECQLSYVLNQIRGTFQGLVTRHHKEVKQFHSHLKTVTNPKYVQIERMAALLKDLSIDFNLCCEELKYIAKEHTKKTKKLKSAIIKSESDESSLKVEGKISGLLTRREYADGNSSRFKKKKKKTSGKRKLNKRKEEINGYSNKVKIPKNETFGNKENWRIGTEAGGYSTNFETQRGETFGFVDCFGIETDGTSGCSSNVKAQNAEGLGNSRKVTKRKEKISKQEKLGNGLRVYTRKVKKQVDEANTCSSKIKKAKDEASGHTRKHKERKKEVIGSSNKEKKLKDSSGCSPKRFKKPKEETKDSSSKIKKTRIYSAGTSSKVDLKQLKNKSIGHSSKTRKQRTEHGCNSIYVKQSRSKKKSGVMTFEAMMSDYIELKNLMYESKMHTEKNSSQIVQLREAVARLSQLINCFYSSTRILETAEGVIQDVLIAILEAEKAGKGFEIFQQALKNKHKGYCALSKNMLGILKEKWSSVDDRVKDIIHDFYQRCDSSGRYFGDFCNITERESGFSDGRYSNFVEESVFEMYERDTSNDECESNEGVLRNNQACYLNESENSDSTEYHSYLSGESHNVDCIKSERSANESRNGERSDNESSDSESSDSDSSDSESSDSESSDSESSDSESSDSESSDSDSSESGSSESSDSDSSDSESSDSESSDSESSDSESSDSGYHASSNIESSDSESSDSESSDSDSSDSDSSDSDSSGSESSDSDSSE